MNAKIEIKFVTINKFIVNDKLIKKVPKLMEATEKTTKKLCKEIKNYFKDHKIEVETSFKLIK